MEIADVVIVSNVIRQSGARLTPSYRPTQNCNTYTLHICLCYFGATYIQLSVRLCAGSTQQQFVVHSEAKQ